MISVKEEYFKYIEEIENDEHLSPTMHIIGER